MKLSIEMVSIIMFALIFLPLIYFIWQGPKNVNRKKKLFKLKTTDLNLKSEDIELFGKLIIGVDRNKNIVCFCNDSQTWQTIERVDLTHASTCAIKTQRNSKAQLEWVSLEVVEGTSLKSIVFYNEHDDALAYSHPMEALLRAEKCKRSLFTTA